MKIPVSLALLSAFAVAACDVDQPPPRTQQRTAARYPEKMPGQYPPPPQPFQPGPAEVQPAPPSQVAASSELSAPPPAASSSAPAVAKGDYPYGLPIPGKPGYVYSPFTPDRPVDVRGFAPGTEVKDPYKTETRIFLVP